MGTAWLDELLPHSVVSPRTRMLWVLFFLLFPLAYVGGVVLQMAEERPARIDGSADRAAAIRIAQQFAASKGFNVSGWQQYAIAKTNDNWLAYYDEAKQPDLAAAGRLTPARQLEVLFRTPDSSREFRVFLSLTGRVTGYDSGKPSGSRDFTTHVGILQVHSNDKQKDSGNEPASLVQTKDAEAIARRALAANGTISQVLKLGTAKVTVNSDDPTRTDVEWDASPIGRSELTFHVRVSVRDSEVVGQRIEANVRKDYAKSNLKKGSQLPTFLNSGYAFFLTFGVVYAIYRYARRTLQKEVSHARTLVVAALFCVSYSALAFSFALDQVATRVSGEALQKITLISYAVSIIVFSIMGLLVGIGYGSGEGELREAYPGKLTSLDALLAGRVFSRDVAASTLFGTAAAGWLLLSQHAVSHFLPTDIVALRSAALNYTFARLPWLTLLLGKQYDSLLIAVAGLLLPASFLLRSRVRKRRRFVWLIVFAVFSVLRDAATYPTAASSLLVIFILVAALLLPFFTFDLLAAIVSLSALSYANELTRLSAVFPSWTEFSLGFSALAVISLGLAAYLALHGRRVREEDVRPTYAKNLAERMSMQAEVLAAREAQLRLLPQSAPQIPGLQLAACCFPAREVGGDFYDFFRLDANRVGIFVAQGGDQGLASALCIALTKGVLMHASLQPLSPTQIILELESSIAELLEDGTAAKISFAYGVMDTRRSLLNYARIGSSPRLLLHRRGISPTTSAQLEREVALSTRLDNSPKIYEGAVQLQLGDHLILFTNGVTSLRSRRIGKREYQWLDLLIRELERPVEPLQTLLVAALGRYQYHAANDLTAVVLRLVPSAAVLQEGVA